MNSHTMQEIKQALEETTLTKTIEPDAYADAAQHFIDEYGTDLHMILGEDIKENSAAQCVKNNPASLNTGIEANSVNLMGHH
jgi:hypothetical protein